MFNRAKEAKELTTKQEATDIINLKITTAQMNKYADKQEMPTLKELSQVLKEDNEIQYVTETSKIAKAEYDVPSEDPTSIYTKLSKYPYEFEINSSLQLASIDGVKLSNSNSQNINQPTGVKWDIWINNSITLTGKYDIKTSMSGLSIAKDTDNKIDEYLSYSNEEGYTVLKSGWYFIYARGMIQSEKSAAAETSIVINDNAMKMLGLWATNYYCDPTFNNFPIYLKENDKFYFSVTSNYATVIKDIAIYCYPMF